jgi:3'-phosphoadenosine 5'-phosphosulfate sulfotransferase (PAPS reductase)/FAD synthetase
MIYVSSLSGGKDSVAMTAWAMRTGLNPVVVTADTGWEFDGTEEIQGWRDYVTGLEAFFGPIRVIRSGTRFVERTLKHGSFPARVRRWCTPELKVEPFAAELDRIREETGDEVTVLVGIRREESAQRATWPEREWQEEYDCEVWRPIIDWTLAEVIAEHHRAGIPLNPLYVAGAERVGCWPCVMAGKSEIAMVARIDPGRIALIRELEAATGTTMFAEDRRTQKRKSGGEGPSVVPLPIDQAVLWAKTARGGRKLALFPQPSGCMRWGICEHAAAPAALFPPKAAP